MELLISGIVFHLAVMFVIPMVAHDRGQDWRWALLWTFAFSLVGGFFALLLLDRNDRQTATAPSRSEGDEVKAAIARGRAERARREGR